MGSGDGGEIRGPRGQHGDSWARGAAWRFAGQEDGRKTHRLGGQRGDSRAKGTAWRLADSGDGGEIHGPRGRQGDSQAWGMAGRLVGQGGDEETHGLGDRGDSQTWADKSQLMAICSTMSSLRGFPRKAGRVCLPALLSNERQVDWFAWLLIKKSRDQTTQCFSFLTQNFFLSLHVLAT